MIFVILALYGILAVFFISKRKIKMSQAVIPMIAFAILSSAALGQNYTVSLIPEANDGIGVSNFLASFLLPADGWTTEIFLSKFESYLMISIALILIYFIMVIVERTRMNPKG